MNKVGKEMKTSIIFISDNTELNAAISRYFKYIRNSNSITFSTFNASQFPTTDTVVIQNEVLINDNVTGIYAFWFDWGMKNNKQVYGLTYKKTDSSNNVINWKDLLNLALLKHFNSYIDYRKIPYFETITGFLSAIMKPHGRESLYNLAARLHSSFVGISNKLRKKVLSKSLLEKIKNTFITPGSIIFEEFQQREKNYHDFLSHLPESQNLFIAIQLLESAIDNLIRINIEIDISISTLAILFAKAEKEVKCIYNFFRNLENYIEGDNR